MSLTPEPSTKWRPRPRIRPKRTQSSAISDEQFIQRHYSIIGENARTHGPCKVDTGLVDGSTRSLKLHFAAYPHAKSDSPPPSTSVISRIGVSNRQCSGSDNFDFPSSAASSDPIVAPAADEAGAASASVQSALPAVPLFPPTQGIPIRHEYLLEMSKKSKRLPKASLNGGGGDIMDSLVSSIDEIDAKQMRGLCAANGHSQGRPRSESIGSVISVSPAPVIQTSKSSTRSPSGTGNKLSRRSSTRSAREANGRQNLRSSGSQEHWLPPIEQEEDIFSVPTSHTSYSSSPSNNSIRHPSIPARTSSITHDIIPPQIPQRSNSLLCSSVPPPITIRPSPRRSENMSDIPSYITRYLRERNDSKENLGLDIPISPHGPISPRRLNHASRNLPSRSRNSTTAIPGNDQFSRLKLVTKRQSSQGFERDMSATRHYYSLPPSTPRRSASLNPSRSSVASDSSNSFSRFNSNYVQEVLTNPKLTQRIRLTTGRILSFSEVGDEKGWPVFCFTGMGLNRLVAGIDTFSFEPNVAFYDEVATSFGLRIITPDRPGIGLSDEIRPSPKKVLAWAGISPQSQF